jgi:MFS transporter, ACS family, tartrate transporter
MRETRRAMILIVMGVTGAGKSTVGSMLADRLGWVFLEADGLHSLANKEKMQRGEPLTDADRGPWLHAIHAELVAQDRLGNNVVLACSALKEEYRRRLGAGLDARFVYLQGSQGLIGERLRARTGHFAGEAILQDQFAALEEPSVGGALVADVANSPDEIVVKILAATGLPTRAEHEFERTLVRKMRWRLLPFLFLLYVVAYLDRINVGFAALQMKGLLGFSNAVYGAGAGIFFLGYFLFQVPSNLALERLGARRWVGTLMVLWGVISSAMFLIHSAGTFYALRFLLGAAEAGFFPGVIYYLRSWFPAESRAGVVALFMTAGPVSGIVGGPISGALLDWGRPGGLAGWQWMFLLEGLPAIVLGVLAWIFLVNGPESARWLTAEEKSWLGTNLAETDRAVVRNRGERHAAPWYASGRLWGLALAYFGLNTCTYGVSLWLPSALESLSGLPNLLLGVVSAVPYIVAATAMVLVGMHSDRTGERRKHVAGCAMVGAVALVAAGFSTALAVSVAAFGIALASSSSMAGPFWAMASGMFAESTAARGIALINAIGNLGSGFGPYWIGYLRDATKGFRAGLWTVAGMLCVAGMLVMKAGTKKNETNNRTK